MSGGAARMLAAAAYAAIAVGAAAAPRMVPRVFGADAPTKASRTEIRAVYAGIPAVFAVALVSRVDGEAGRGRLRVVRDATLAMAGVRAVSALFERDAAPWPTAAFVGIELGIAAGAHHALRTSGG